MNLLRVRQLYKILTHNFSSCNLLCLITIQQCLGRIARDEAADVLLWKNKKISGGALGVATAIWVFFELLEYHFLTLICHSLILVLTLLFLWSNAHTFIHKTAPHIPVVHLPEEPILQFAVALRIEINRGFTALRDIGSGRDLKKTLSLIQINLF
ncbi:hypothetical protein RYX36_017372 [Vicia faba]